MYKLAENLEVEIKEVVTPSMMKSLNEMGLIESNTIGNSFEIMANVDDKLVKLCHIIFDFTPEQLKTLNKLKGEVDIKQVFAALKAFFLSLITT